ncbi:DHS-like NAD/FAD-binding domain-containing protein [Halteromyces radiatus]|uniref:DHS-like NAD/FAD-binding domain-containing protein n=1 Tax=Halteromyces radiatus TaxID=101107 RepID=UPI00221F8813|nr:DHS-like NAD/FAD-binding domain-containing protein [Halteromyces radiatus]KAI8082783.1 DHS-like NAD/FAD-binding domain-containing protein [Halteromyces radiatus]
MNPSDDLLNGTSSNDSTTTTMKRCSEVDQEDTLKESTDLNNDVRNDRSLKRTKYDQDTLVDYKENDQRNTTESRSPSPPATTPFKNNSNNSTNLGDALFDENYNEESDADWASGFDGDSASEGGSSPELLHSALRLDEDIDVEESDEESQYILPWTSFTEEEMESIQEDAREIGLMKFIEKYVLQLKVPVAKLLEVFGFIMHPKAIMIASDLELAPVLRTVVNRFLRKRRRLEHVNTLDDVVELMSKAQNIMIVTGAGVSVSCGIPDFRSETGIYSRLQEYQLDDPQQMFDIEYFRESPEIFYSFAKELYPSKYEPSPSHEFVKLVEEQGKLLRNYTQNIDTLEHKANIKNVVNCHGSFATASCVTCGYKCDGKDIEEHIFAQTVPPCPKCPTPKPLKQHNRNSDDSDDDDDGDGNAKGTSIMKPDITFFGEKLPDEFDNLLAVDTDKVDLLIVMGSSLKVSPVSEIMTQIPHRVPQILINRTPITHMTFDVQLLGNSDDIVPELCRRLHWDLRHDKLPGGSALSEESMQLSRQGDGDLIDSTTNDMDQTDSRTSERHIWKQLADGLYTFPGAVLDERYFNAQRCDERGSINDTEEDSDQDDNDKPNDQSLLDAKPNDPII